MQQATRVHFCFRRAGHTSCNPPSYKLPSLIYYSSIKFAAWKPNQVQWHITTVRNALSRQTSLTTLAMLQLRRAFNLILIGANSEKWQGVSGCELRAWQFRDVQLQILPMYTEEQWESQSYNRIIQIKKKTICLFYLIRLKVQKSESYFKKYYLLVFHSKGQHLLKGIKTKQTNKHNSEI